MNDCDTVAERIALGEPLGDLSEHAASCARCRGLVALPTELGALRHASDPGLGFTARLTSGAQHRLAVRRRRRVALGLAGAVAAAALAVFAFTRQPDEGSYAVTVPQLPQPAAITNHTPDPWKDPSPDAIDPDARALVHMAHAARAHHHHARWSRIEKPLAPYRELLEGVSP